MLAGGSNAQSEGSFVNDECNRRRAQQAEPQQRIVETGCLDVAAKAGDARRIRRAREKQFEKKSGDADRKQIDRDADYNLIGSIANAGDRVNHTKNQSTKHAGEYTDPRIAA